MLKLERFFMQGVFFGDALELPGGDITEFFVVTFGFTVWGLVILAEMRPAGFVAMEGILDHERGEFEVVGGAEGFFEGLVEIIGGAGYGDVLPEFVAEFGDFFGGFS